MLREHDRDYFASSYHEPTMSRAYFGTCSFAMSRRVAMSPLLRINAPSIGANDYRDNSQYHYGITLATGTSALPSAKKVMVVLLT